MKANNNKKRLFERLKEGLEEGIAHARGEVELRTTDIPDKPPKVGKKQLIALRDQLQLSIEAFARLLNVPLATVRRWESGKRSPSYAALRLIQICTEQPEVAQKFIGQSRNGNKKAAPTMSR